MVKVKCEVNCIHHPKGYCKLKAIQIEDWGYEGLRCSKQKEGLKRAKRT